MKHKHMPPSFGRRILRLFVHAEFLEEVEGDLEELFDERLSHNSVWWSKLLYLVDVIRTIRPYQPKRKASAVGHEIMHGIFWKLAFRNLLKQKTQSFINIAGLSIGLVSFLLIIEYVTFEKSFDSFHSRKEMIYRVAFNWGETDYKGENSSVYASSVPAMGPVLQQELADVKSFTRFIPVLTVKPSCVFTANRNNKTPHAVNADRGFYADSSFLKIFSFSILAGSDKALYEPKTIAITKSFAEKIFGSIPYDKMVGLTIEVDQQQKEEHIITAVLEDVPSNSHLQFDYLISYATINSERLDGNLGWSQFYTYVEMHQPISVGAMGGPLKKLIEKLYGTESTISIFFQPLEEIYLSSHLREEAGPTGSSQQLTFLSIIAYMILLMAWINYINMFLARAMARVNEIGIKKVLGSSKAHLLVQFFTEAMIINLISLALAIGLAALIQQPFELWLGKEISSVLYSEIPSISSVLAGILLGCILAGLYPASVLASYKPVQILGSKYDSSSSGIFLKSGLVYFQFVVSFIIVAGALIINRQIDFMKHADLGMNLESCIAVRTPGNTDSTYGEKMKLYKERLLKSAFVKQGALTSSIPGRQIITSGGVQRVVGPSLDGNNVLFMQVDESFLDTYEIRLIAGKHFSQKGFAIPSVIINEAALKTLKFESPKEALNHRIHWQRKEYEVIGVFANYNHLFLKETFEPLMLSYSPAPVGFMTLKVQAGYHNEALAAAKKEMRSLFPDTPFEYTFLQSSFNYQYHGVQQFDTLAKYFALLAIFIACLGLFALSFYSARQRTREVAVRKIFGARLLDVFWLLAMNYVKAGLISCLIGSCITFYVMREWLENFAFSIALDSLDFLVPIAVLLWVIVMTVSYNCIRAASINTSHALKQF
jgi:putative ABC transport system permease protein